MKNKIIKIEPVNIEITELKVFVEYSLGESATLHWSFLMSDGRPIDNGFIKLTPEEFGAWGTDDSYIEDLVLSKLGLTKA